VSGLTDLVELLILGFGLVGAGVFCLVLPHLWPAERATRRRRTPARRITPPRRRRHRVRPGAITVAELSHRLALTMLAGELR